MTRGKQILFGMNYPLTLLRTRLLFACFNAQHQCITGGYGGLLEETLPNISVY